MPGTPSRFAVRLSALAVAAVLTVPAARAADDLDPPTPADLVRGLREAGLSDLALEYLKDASERATPDGQIVLTLERARLRVEMAELEPDEGKREAELAQARMEFDDFLKKAPRHPRGAEAAASLAQMLAVQASTQFVRAVRGPEAALKAEAAKARDLYTQAQVRFADAVNRLTTAADAATGARKKALTRELFQTKLDAAVAQYKLGTTYLTKLGQASERGAAILVSLRGRAADKKGATALTGFDALGREDPAQPACWVARAWVFECNQQLDDRKSADDAFRALQTDHRRTNTDASRAGYRMARFLDLRYKFDKAGTPAENKAVADAAEQWLTDYRGRATAETYSVMYYRGRALFDQAALIVAQGEEAAKSAKPPRTYTVPPDVVQMFRNSEAELRKLLAVDTEYTDRATRYRNFALRRIVGDAVKPPMQYGTFDECHMAGLVQYIKMTEADTADKRAALLPVVTGLLERARQLPVPAESAREAQTSTLMLVSVYRLTGRSAEAAVLAESALRAAVAANSAANVAKFGRQALVAYLESAAKVPANDPAGKRADTERALAVAAAIDAKVPTDPLAEEARIIVADQLNRDGKPLEAFDTYARVTPRAARYAAAKLQQGGIAYTLIRPLPADSPEARKRPALSPDQKARLYTRATADLTSVPRPPADAPAADAQTYIRAQLQLAQLHVAAGSADTSREGEKAVDAAKAAIPTFAQLKGDDRETLLLQAELVRVDAVFEQARLLMKADKFREAADLLAKLLGDGPAVKDGQSAEVGRLAARLDASRLSYAVVPALNARVRDGDIPKAAELLDQLKKLGGDARRGIAAVFEVVESSRPQVEAMKRANQADAAAKLNASVAQLVAKVADEKNLTAGDHVILGGSFLRLGDYAKALDVLGRVPKPDDPAFLKGEVPPPKKEENEPDDEFKKKYDAWLAKAMVQNRYRLATLDTIRAYRLSGDLAKCEALIDEVMGKEVADPKVKGRFVREGLFAKRPEHRRESFHLLEAKAQATDPAKATPVWVRAIGEWGAMKTEYQRVLVQPDPKDEVQAGVVRRQRDAARPVFFDLFYEQARCQMAAATHIGTANPKSAEAVTKNVATNLVNMEKANAAEFPRDTHAHLTDLLDANPALRKAYADAGGKMFLTKPADDR